MRSPIFSAAIAAIAKSSLIPVNYKQLSFGVAAGVILSEDANLITWSILVTYDDFSTDAYNGSIQVSQTLTTITVTDPTLPLRGGVVAGDIIQLRKTGGVDGTYVVATTPSTTSYTVTSAVSQSFTGAQASEHAYWRLFAAPAGLTAQTTRTSASLSLSNVGPITGLLLSVTARTAGSATLVVVQGEGP